MNRPYVIDLVNYRISRANETINEVKNLIELGYLNTAVNRLYYACYYAVCALLLKHNISTKTHTGVRRMFGQNFITSGIISHEIGKHYTNLFEMRHKGDYSDFIKFDKETIEKLLEPSKKFIQEIELLLKK